MQELDANAGTPNTHLVPQNSNFEINLRKFQVIINFFLKFNVLSSFNTLIFFFFLYLSISTGNYYILLEYHKCLFSLSQEW